MYLFQVSIPSVYSHRRAFHGPTIPIKAPRVSPQTIQVRSARGVWLSRYQAWWSKFPSCRGRKEKTCRRSGLGVEGEIPVMLIEMRLSAGTLVLSCASAETEWRNVLRVWPLSCRSFKAYKSQCFPLLEIFSMKRCCLCEWEATSGAIELRRRSNDGLTEGNIPKEQTLQNSQQPWRTLQRPKGCVFLWHLHTWNEGADENEAELRCTDQGT
jgi:hypothetical protein